MDISGDALFNGLSEIVDEDDPRMSQTAEHSIKFKTKFDKHETAGFPGDGFHDRLDDHGYKRL